MLIIGNRPDHFSDLKLMAISLLSIIEYCRVQGIFEVFYTECFKILLKVENVCTESYFWEYTWPLFGSEKILLEIYSRLL